MSREGSHLGTDLEPLQTIRPNQFFQLARFCTASELRRRGIERDSDVLARLLVVVEDTVVLV